MQWLLPLMEMIYTTVQLIFCLGSAICIFLTASGDRSRTWLTIQPGHLELKRVPWMKCTWFPASLFLRSAPWCKSSRILRSMVAVVAKRLSAFCIALLIACDLSFLCLGCAPVTSYVYFSILISVYPPSVFGSGFHLAAWYSSAFNFGISSCTWAGVPNTPWLALPACLYW